ncbi:hypothetical protein VE03_10704 [Pseudogymnoascus sp. 23342-1-I1]|nr:hypothetical protein VE03_10704 [Pseudogymnoascus sp. 23342-1-I1]
MRLPFPEEEITENQRINYDSWKGDGGGLDGGAVGRVWDSEGVEGAHEVVPGEAVGWRVRWQMKTRVTWRKERVTWRKERVFVSPMRRRWILVVWMKRRRVEVKVGGLGGESASRTMVSASGSD